MVLSVLFHSLVCGGVMFVGIRKIFKKSVKKGCLGTAVATKF